MRHRIVPTVFAALLASLSACTEPTGSARPGGTPTDSRPAPSRYAQPRDPCDAIPDTLTRRLGLEHPTRHVYGRFQRDDSQPDDPPAAYDDTTCEWTVANRANQMTASISYSVIDSHRASAERVAAAILVQSRKRFGKAKKIEGTPLDGHDGYYIYAHQKSATGADAVVDAAVRVENAVVEVRFTGADLSTDRSKPVGLQLRTRPVDEKRLRPTVLSLLPAAVRYLTKDGGR